MKVGTILALKKPLKATSIKPTLFTVNKKMTPELIPPALMFPQALPALKEPIISSMTICDHQTMAEEINQLIKKMCLNFTDKKLEAKFLMSGGIFDQAQFSIIISSQGLCLEVKNASSFAQNLLLNHQDFLENRLKAHRIGFNHLKFI